jgi:LuxR family maltose regulon positive regulatory protein
LVVKAEVEMSLLTTKLNIPPSQANLVARSRLIERLQECLSCNFVLISAPAGFGKTTLLSEWARQNQPRIHTAWISLDEGDNDPIRFWDYFIAALKTLQPAFGESTLALLHSPQLPPVESLLTVLINELAVISSRFVLILDDYHLITAKPVHDGLTYLLERMPSKMRILMATRADPPLPLAHFRGRGMMLEIRTDDLRFSRDEAIALFRGMRTPVLTDEDAGVLDSHTQGWVVGLKMAALAMREHPDVPGFLASFSGSQRYIMDYLMEEVLQRQSEDVKDFLLKTSVLERLTAPLCDSITGSSDSHDMLLKLEHDNLFIAPLDESRQWYRYEHLFRDLLSHQLEVTLGVRDIAVLHRRASHWYEQNKYPDDTIHHALAAQDWESAMRLTGAIAYFGDMSPACGAG